MTRDHRDLAIEMMARDEYGITLELLLESESYRQVARAALDLAHDLDRQLRREREAHRRTWDEYRRLRETIVREAA